MPLRIEIGPKDIEKSRRSSWRAATRGQKSSMPMDGLDRGAWSKLLDEIQAGAAARARGQFREEHTTRVATYDEFKAAMEGRPGFVIAGWCGSAECEAQIKAETQATLRNIPFGGEPRRRHLREVRQAVDASRRGSRRRISSGSGLGVRGFAVGCRC